MKHKLEVRSHVPESELAAARQFTQRIGRRRDWLSTTVTTGLEAPERDGEQFYLKTKPGPAFGRRAVHDIRDSLIERRLTAAQRLQAKSPAEWKDIIDKLRLAHPELVSSLTDAEVYRIVVEKTSREATERVLKRKGRG